MKKLICAYCDKILTSFPALENVYATEVGGIELFCSQKCKKAWEKIEQENMMKRYKQIEVSDDIKNFQ